MAVLDGVVLATHNTHKVTEVRRILAPTGVHVISLDEVVAYPEPAETERTFEGNALLKARICAAITGAPALADDSGLEVDILNRMPGVRSARWSGTDATDEDNLGLLLRQLADVPDAERTARFVCALALVLPDGREFVRTGTMEGRMGHEARGTQGFGYDPAFIALGQARTNGELDPAEKDALSHRGEALRAMADLIGELNDGSRR